MKSNAWEMTRVEGEHSEVRESANVVDFAKTLQDLKKTVGPGLIKQRAGDRDPNGRVHIVEYVEWHTVADILDEHASSWSHSVKDIRAIGDIVIVTVAISVDGITREGIGTGCASSEMGIKKAEHDALKRAAVKFGIARDLYKREFDSSTGGSPIPDAFSAVARTVGELVTTKQLNMIRAIARRDGLDAEKESRERMLCSLDELSRRAASDLIEHLQTLQKVDIRRAG